MKKKPHKLVKILQQRKVYDVVVLSKKSEKSKKKTRKISQMSFTNKSQKTPHEPQITS